MMHNVIVVRVGVICRILMAEASLKQALLDKIVFFAGIAAIDGCAADPMAVASLQQHDMDVGEHLGQSLARWMVARPNLVFMMDLHQNQYVEQNYPAAKGIVFRLGE